MGIQLSIRETLSLITHHQSTHTSKGKGERGGGREGAFPPPA